MKTQHLKPTEELKKGCLKGSKMELKSPDPGSGNMNDFNIE